MNPKNVNVLYALYSIAAMVARRTTTVVKTHRPGFMAIVGDEVRFYDAVDFNDLEIPSGEEARLINESSLPADRIAILDVVAFQLAGNPKIGATVAYLIIGEVKPVEVQKMIGQLCERLTASAAEGGRDIRQTKIQVDGTDVKLATYHQNKGGTGYTVVDGAEQFGFDNITTIDAATSTESDKRQLVIGGTKDGIPTVQRFSVQSGEKTGSIVLPDGTTEIRRVAIDRQSLSVAILTENNDGTTKGYLNAAGTTECAEASKLDGATKVVFKGDGMFAFGKSGELQFYARREEDQSIDFTMSSTLLTGLDASEIELHDVRTPSHASRTSDTDRVVTLRNRSATSKGAAPKWTTTTVAVAA